MTQAKTALAGLARAASGTVLAIGEMSGAELLASLTDEQRAELSASLPAAVANGLPQTPSNGSDDNGNPDYDDGAADDGDKCPKCGDQMQDGKCKKCSPDASASAQAQGTAQAAQDRVKAVAGAAAIKGREALALSMLADDEFATLSASAIVKIVASSGAAPAASGESDEADRAAMRAALSASANSTISASGGASQADTTGASGWARAAAKANANLLPPRS